MPATKLLEALTPASLLELHIHGGAVGSACRSGEISCCDHYW